MPSREWSPLLSLCELLGVQVLPHARIRDFPEDFQVDEIPPPISEPEPGVSWVRIRKRLLTTVDAVRAMQEQAEIGERDISVAGLKDRNAVTTQWVSVPTESLSKLERLNTTGLELLEVRDSGFRLRRGQLQGNRFAIRIRGLAPKEAHEVIERFQSLAIGGLPNAFGPQRFGVARRNHLLGEALAKGDADAFVHALVKPVPGESESVAAGRAALARGDDREALRLLPRNCVAERRVAGRRRGEDLVRTLRRLPHRLRSLLVSAWQSGIFNEVLRRRFGLGLDAQIGDVLMFDTGRTCFLLTEERFTEDITRVREGLLVPAGPLPGWKFMRAQGEPGAVESEVFQQFELERISNRILPKKALRGARRPFLVSIKASSATLDSEQHLVVQFTLPGGSFATSVLDCLGIPTSPEVKASNRMY